MKVSTRLKLLQQIYAIHDQFASEFHTACRPGCSTCCTCNVTATTMEGLLIVEHLMAEGRIGDLGTLAATAPRARFQPKVTINQMAALCVRGAELPEEISHTTAGPCPLLEKDRCTIYPVRPLGCRAMLSTSTCIPGDEARMPPRMLTINNIFMQFIEAVDQPGGNGNLIDVLVYLSQDTHRQVYLGRQAGKLTERLLANQSMPVLMVPPEHRQAIQPLIQALNAAVQRFNSEDVP